MPVGPAMMGYRPRFQGLLPRRQVILLPILDALDKSDQSRQVQPLEQPVGPAADAPGQPVRGGADAGLAEMAAGGRRRPQGFDRFQDRQKRPLLPGGYHILECPFILTSSGF